MMKVKLSDSAVGLVFTFDFSNDEYMITKREKQPDQHSGLLTMELLNLESALPFYVVIDTRSDEFRLYSDPIFGLADNADAEYSQNDAKQIIEQPKADSNPARVEGFNLDKQGLVFFNRGLYDDANKCFHAAISSTDDQAIEDNMLYNIASILADYKGMRLSGSALAGKVFERLDWLDNTRHRDVARLMWVCLYWQYGKSVLNFTNVAQRFEVLKDEMLNAKKRVLPVMYEPIIQSLKNNVSDQTRVLFFDFTLE